MRLFVSLVVGAAVLATLETHALWEYWVWPPSSLAERACAGGPVRWAVMGLDEAAPQLQLPDPGSSARKRVREACHRLGGCDGQTELEIAAADCGGATPPAALDAGVAAEIWQKVRTSDGYARAWRDVWPGRGAYATIVSFAGDRGEERVVVAATSPVRPTRLGDDTYRHAEWRLARTDGKLRVVAAQTYRFDVAGVEFLTWPMLFFLNLAILVIVWSVARAARALSSVLVRAVRGY